MPVAAQPRERSGVTAQPENDRAMAHGLHADGAIPTCALARRFLRAGSGGAPHRVSLRQPSQGKDVHMSSLEDQILDGMDIYDVDGAKIGQVVRYDPKLGYFETVGAFSGSRYIPFDAIERIGPTGATLNVTK